MDVSRTLITDPIAMNTSLDVGDNGTNVTLTINDARIIAETMQQLQKTLRKEAVSFYWNDHKFSILRDSCVTFEEDETVRVDLSVRNSQVQRLTYTLFRHNHSKRWMLRAIVNPTSLLAGNNVYPIAANAARESSYKETLSLFKAPMSFFLELLRTISNVELSDKTQLRIKKGLIQVSNCQWAFYIKSKDRRATVDVIRHLFQRLSIESSGENVYIGQILGLSPFVDPDMAEYSVMLIKQRGKNKVFSLGIYDKLTQMESKGCKVSVEQRDFLLGHVRVDITFHRPMLEILINQAKKRLRDMDKGGGWVDTFLDTDCVDASTISRAVAVLSCYNDDGVWKRGKFSRYLVERIMFDELHLDSLLSANSGFELPENEPDTVKQVFNFWKQGKYEYTEKFGPQAQAALGKMSSKTLYKAINKLRTIGIDVGVPYTFIEQLHSLDSIYGLTKEERVKLRTTQSPGECRNLLELGHRRIQGSRAEVLHTVLAAVNIPVLVRYKPK